MQRGQRQAPHCVPTPTEGQAVGTGRGSVWSWLWTGKVNLGGGTGSALSPAHFKLESTSQTSPRLVETSCLPGPSVPSQHSTSGWAVAHSWNPSSSGGRGGGSQPKASVGHSARPSQGKMIDGLGRAEWWRSWGVLGSRRSATTEQEVRSSESGGTTSKRSRPCLGVAGLGGRESSAARAWPVRLAAPGPLLK